MAPLPSADLPLSQRVLALVKTLQFAWFSGHLMLLLCISRFTPSWVSWNWYSTWAKISYRTAFMSAALTYGIVVYKTWRARQKIGNKHPGGVVGIMSDENVQYLAMALVWLISPPYYFSMLPYGVYSIFHVATYTRNNLIPTIQPYKAPASASPSPTSQSGNPIADAIGSFVKRFYDKSMFVVSGLEIFIWLRLAFDALLWQRRSWILITCYTAFLRTRYAQSSHVQTTLSTFESRIDSLVGAQSTPPVLRSVWEGVKNAARQFSAVTDLTKYTNGSAVPKKTS
ncbi:hypothetical protein F4779DRAFT_615999 [Xylariaceae sp. FL0662B]|nr:hypothetical protein F4779DRAFT_615999 [Xylariaceae sp. FL0662B]